MPELRRDPVTGRWVIISTDRQKRPNDFHFERATAIGRERCPFCAGPRGDDAARGAGVPARRRRAQHAGLGRARRAEQVSGAAGRGDARSRGRGDVRPDERHRRARGDHRDAGSRSAAGAAVRDRDRARAVGVPRADARSEARLPAAVHPRLQEPRRGGGRDARASALAADRAADRARLRARGDRGRAPALRGQGALRLLRHRPPGAARRSAGDPGERGHRSRSRRTRRASRSRPGCCRSGTARGSRRRRGTNTRAWRGC